MIYKTTKQHFEIFKKNCQKWINIFGLKEWRVDFRHGTYSEHSYGSIYWDYSGKCATIYLTEEWDEEVDLKQLEKTAFHEVCELLLCVLFDMVDKDKYSYDEKVKEFHTVIRRLENSVFDKF